MSFSQFLGKNGQWEVSLNKAGHIEQMVFAAKDGRRTVGFRNDDHAGPSWYLVQPEKTVSIPLQPATGTSDGVQFDGLYEDVSVSLRYMEKEGRPAIVASIQNNSPAVFAPITAGIKLGLDTYMEKYPDWDKNHFPTLLRCEKTHFWGYAMTPERKILAMCSPDPVASWSLDYNYIKHKNKEGEYGGHRIYTLNIDLLNKLTLPDRHPQDLTLLQPGEKRSWTIYLYDACCLEEVKPQAAALCRAPMLEIDRYTVADGETSNLTIYSGSDIRLEVSGPNGDRTEVTAKKDGESTYRATYNPDQGVGVYTFTVSTDDGKNSEARIYLRHPWSWYLKQARRGGIRPQKDLGGFESWHNFFSIFNARNVLPNEEIDSKAEANWQAYLPLFFDTEKRALISDKSVPFPVDLDRITNGTYLASIFARRFRCTQNLDDLENAAALIDALMKYQRPNGGYYTPQGILYTSACYLAKLVLEVALEEWKLAGDSELWRERCERHWKSGNAAIEHLLKCMDDVETEGEQTFEDGMISGTALQLAMYALLEKDPETRKTYTNAAIHMTYKHHCLEQLLIPDCRMNGATLRFWEAQYDLSFDRNMMNSPHGWGGQKLYSSWYLYLLTGDELWLRDLMNTLGASMQVIDSQTGRLRSMFVSDPFVWTKSVTKDTTTGETVVVEPPIGEQYLEMTRDENDSSPNIVHEVFRGLEETALTMAYVLERESGEIVCWNCRVKEGGIVSPSGDGAAETSGTDALVVEPYEDIVGSVHFNLKRNRDVKVLFIGEPVAARVDGMQWVQKSEAYTSFWPPEMWEKY